MDAEARPVSDVRLECRVCEEFLYARTIDQQIHERQRDWLREEQGGVAQELEQAESEELDIEATLDYTEALTRNAPVLWSEASVEQKQRLQSVFFPEGLAFDGSKFGTAPMCLASGR